MKTLHLMLLRMLLPVLLVAMVFFVLLLELIDLFPNLTSYIDKDVPVRVVLSIALHYVPKCIWYAIPVGLLFAVSFTLGTLYRDNELIAIFGSGVSLRILVLPLILVGLLASAGLYLLQEYAVIDTYRTKNELHRQAVRRTVSLSNANVVVLSDDGRAIYQADYYDDARRTLRELTVLIDDPVAYRRYDAKWADYRDGRWFLHDCILYAWTPDGGFTWERRGELEARDFMPEGPGTFQKPTRDVEEMRADEARLWVHRLQKSGLPYLEAQTEYYMRYFFSLTPLIVTLISCAVGGRFRKNILLMNLLFSLVLSVVYYVVQMVAVILAKNEIISPLLGAGGATVALLAVGLGALRAART